MKFKINNANLLQGLGRIQAIVERRGTLPILSNVLIKATSDGITLAATDLEVGVVSTHPAEIEQEGSVTLAAKKLFEIVRELDEDDVNFGLEDGTRVRIECGSARFSLLSISPEEYPTIPGAEGVTFVELESSLLAEMIDRTLYATSSDETRYNLNGVYMELTDENRVRFVATDGHRLAKIDKTPPHPVAFLENGIIVPRKGVSEIRKLCDETDGPVEIGLGEGFLIVRRPGLLLSSRLIDGEFPNYRQVMPSDFRIRLVMDRDRLTHALRRIALLAHERSRGFRFVLEKGGLELSASNPDLGEAREILLVDYSGDRFESGFNARYMLDALSAMTSKEVLIELVDELAPAQLRPADDADYLAVVMPMRM
ncbi:MAG: DNA polymerase III subunit beta [Deltaproteobacteria bacterium]|nr:DNA polymerase III subunit beta [Deltaproteobacteria bacterium]